MPCIKSKVNTAISQQQELALKEALGKAIAILPGKTERWLMLTFEENCHIYFKGSNQSAIGFVEVQIFGKSTAENYEKLTAEITRIFHEILNIEPCNLYVKYEESDDWGWNGTNF